MYSLSWFFEPSLTSETSPGVPHKNNKVLKLQTVVANPK